MTFFEKYTPFSNFNVLGLGRNCISFSEIIVSSQNIPFPQVKHNEISLSLSLMIIKIQRISQTGFTLQQKMLLSTRALQQTKILGEKSTPVLSSLSSEQTSFWYIDVVVCSSERKSPHLGQRKNLYFYGTTPSLCVFCRPLPNDSKQSQISHSEIKHETRILNKRDLSIVSRTVSIYY